MPRPPPTPADDELELEAPPAPDDELDELGELEQQEVMTSVWIPEEPAPIPDRPDSAPARVSLRFEDVSQDGFLVLEALPAALGAVWRQLAAEERGRPRSAEPGVVAILSRVVVEGGEGPIAVSAAAEAEGTFEVAQVPAADGGVERIVLAMWARILAPKGRTHGPPPEGAGERIVAGRVFAEHVFTRPFGDPSARKVRSLLGADGKVFVPEKRWTWQPSVAALVIPEGAQAIDAALVADGHATVFGKDHTDGNQHVNSLVYPRLVIEAALRRFARLESPPKPRLARALEIAFRKPCFAGETARVSTRAFTWNGRMGVTAAVLGDADGPSATPRCAARLLFDV